MRTVGMLLFPGFELLDVFGPLEVFGSRVVANEFHVCTVAREAGPVASAQGPRAVADHGFDDCPRLDLFIVPGGQGTRREVDDPRLTRWIAAAADEAATVASVCTGAALLARAGLLDGRRATTNKLAFDWVTSQGPHVEWIRKARWVEDGKFFTSSGVSAGIDMALRLVEHLLDAATADAVAKVMEYRRHADADDDPFAR
jgi:transcriptional regulator GlxA family with amidase domain